MFSTGKDEPVRRTQYKRLLTMSLAEEMMGRKEKAIFPYASQNQVGSRTEAL